MAGKQDQEDSSPLADLGLTFDEEAPTPGEHELPLDVDVDKYGFDEDETDKGEEKPKDEKVEDEPPAEKPEDEKPKEEKPSDEEVDWEKRYKDTQSSWHEEHQARLALEKKIAELEAKGAKPEETAPSKEVSGDEELIAKFRNNARQVLPARKVERAAEYIMNLESCADIHDLMECLVK